MPRYIIKLNTFDPTIIEVFEQLRKSRKQAAFTHEALKHFTSSAIGVQTIQFMTESLKPILAASSVNIAYPIKATEDPAWSTTRLTKGPGGQTTTQISEVLEMILK